jgi:hypothetical protein
MSRTTRKCLQHLAVILQDALAEGSSNLGNIRRAEPNSKKRGIPSKFANLNTMVDYLTTKVPRQQANILLKRENREKLLPSWFLGEYENYRQKEAFHVTHVRTCMDKLLPDKVPNQHDHSKDELYFLITTCAYNITDDRCKVPAAIIDKLVEGHYRAEPHHPEYEKLNKEGKIKDKDIIETAVDRLSRNLQFNQGQYNTADLTKYEPKFVRDHKNRITLYRAYTDALMPMVLETWETLKKKPAEEN